MEHRQPRFQRGRTDIGHQSPLKTRAQPVFQRRDGLGRAVASQNYLRPRLVQVVEGVEQRFLRLLFSHQELHIVQQQQVEAPVAFAKFRHRAAVDRGHELVGELFGSYVADRNTPLTSQVSDSVQQVGLPHPGSGVQQQRIVTGDSILPIRVDGSRGVVSQLVAFADHEIVEGIPRVDPNRLVGLADLPCIRSFALRLVALWIYPVGEPRRRLRDYRIHRNFALRRRVVVTRRGRQVTNA